MNDLPGHVATLAALAVVALLGGVGGLGGVVAAEIPDAALWSAVIFVAGIVFGLIGWIVVVLFQINAIQAAHGERINDLEDG